MGHVGIGLPIEAAIAGYVKRRDIAFARANVDGFRNSAKVNRIVPRFSRRARHGRGRHQSRPHVGEIERLRAVSPIPLRLRAGIDLYIGETEGHVRIGLPIEAAIASYVKRRAITLARRTSTVRETRRR